MCYPQRISTDPDLRKLGITGINVDSDARTSHTELAVMLNQTHELLPRAFLQRSSVLIELLQPTSLLPPYPGDLGYTGKHLGKTGRESVKIVEG